MGKGENGGIRNKRKRKLAEKKRAEHSGKKSSKKKAYEVPFQDYTQTIREWQWQARNERDQQRKEWVDYKNKKND